MAGELGARNAVYAHLDVRVAVQWEAVLETCRERFGPPTLLVHNAGVMVAGSIEDATEGQFCLAFEVNMLGAFLGTRAVIPVMRAAGGGAIVIVSSAGGLEGTPGMALYAASKAANANFTRSAALELAADGIRVNAVAPGLIDTDMSRAVLPFVETQGLVDFAVGHGAAITRPVDAISAQFSLAFGTGLQFVTGRNAPADYLDPARWSDPEILAIGDLVEPYAMPMPDGDPVFSAKVEIVLHDGTTLEHYQAGFRGHPSHPVTAAQVEGKFRKNTVGLVTAARVDALVTAIGNLESGETVRDLTALLG